jgi:hypothetical protein
MIRFDAHDAELERWLGQFAQTQSMTKVVKLACYMLAGLQPSEGLLAVLPHVEQARHLPAAPTALYMPPNEHASDALAAVMQELAALREVVAGSPPTGIARPSYDEGRDYWPDPVPEARRSQQTWQSEDWSQYEDRPADPDGKLSASSGLDMSRRRRGRGSSAKRAAARSPVTIQPDTRTSANDGALALLASIRAYCDFQGGR